MMEGSSPNDSIISLLDDSWHSQFLLKHSVASGVPESCSNSAGVEPETLVRSSEVDSAIRTSSNSIEGSSLQSVDDYSHLRTKEKSSSFGRSSMDESEMRRVFDRFDSNGDGLISKEELHWYMKCCGTVVTDAEANSMISSVDLNNDGNVDFEEFLLLYRTHRSADATGENDETCADEEQDLLEAFHVFDANDDGFISAHELQAVLLNLGIPEGKSLTNCEEMIRTVDRDGDGQCDVREFQEMMAARSF